MRRWILMAGPLLLGACATSPDTAQDPRITLQEICSTGESVESVKGSIWLRAKSKEASGQFPAYVTVKAPDQVDLEVTNLLGGTEAKIRVRGNSYRIDAPKRPTMEQSGVESWGGIPLHWATDLFLGRVPCPPSEDKSTRVIREGSNELRVEVQAKATGEKEIFVYQFKSWAGKAWPEKLHWEINGTSAASVSFEFKDPEEKTRSPLRWEAKSPRGEVKVRWKDREAL